MGAHPKNKITRVEQGKRRAGNTPKLRKDTSVSRVPLHKQDYFRRLLKKIGSTATTKVTSTEKKAKKVKSITNVPAVQTIAPTAAAATPTVQKVRRTQQKGGG